MAVTLEEMRVLRELAKRYRECAEDPANREREARARRINGLVPERPLVWIHELPLNELDVDGQLTLRCTDDFARKMEMFFRHNLLRWKYFQADSVLEPFYRINKAYTSTGDGMEVLEKVRAIDNTNHIISHEYMDLLDTEEKLEQLQIPVITAQPELDAENVALAEAILGDILPVRLTGGYHYADIWDRISRLRGVQPIYMDLAMRPEFMHKTVQKFVKIHEAVIDQKNRLGLFSCDLQELHCTPSWSDELDRREREDGPGAASTWFRGLAQLFGSVSPDMHEEFEFDYILPLAERFGYTYYGCCEPLSDRIDKLKKIRNLRKIGVSPWSDVWASAEQIGGDYVLSRKPNPALVAGVLNEDAVRADIRETAEACIRYGCPCDIVLKDISTVGYKIGNLVRWAQIAEETLDEYY